MAVIDANYAVMAAGGQDLVTAWGRIEAQLERLDQLAGSTRDMRADAIESYLRLKTQWTASAADRQLALHELARYVDEARSHYQRMDAMLAAQFAG